LKAAKSEGDEIAMSTGSVNADAAFCLRVRRSRHCNVEVHSNSDRVLWPQYYRFPIVVEGSTIISVKNGRVIRWSDYNDRMTSRRVGLASSFKEWIEY
jgi:hypothetical protein